MRLRLPALRLVALALALASAAVVAAPAGARIVPQRGIGGVELGMTRAAVERKLGPPLRVIRGRNEFGPWTELRYPYALGVVLQGNRSVTSVQTTSRRERTASGIGVGSTEGQLRRALPRARCRTEYGFRHCWLGAFLPGRRVTDFSIRRGRVIRVTVAFVLD